jgi:hypothetical protein
MELVPSDADVFESFYPSFLDFDAKWLELKGQVNKNTTDIRKAQQRQDYGAVSKLRAKNAPVDARFVAMERIAFVRRLVPPASLSALHRIFAFFSDQLLDSDYLVRVTWLGGSFYTHSTQCMLKLYLAEVGCQMYESGVRSAAAAALGGVPDRSLIESKEPLTRPLVTGAEHRKKSPLPLQVGGGTAVCSDALCIPPSARDTLHDIEVELLGLRNAIEALSVGRSKFPVPEGKPLGILVRAFRDDTLRTLQDPEEWAGDEHKAAVMLNALSLAETEKMREFAAAWTRFWNSAGAAQFTTNPVFFQLSIETHKVFLGAYKRLQKEKRKRVNRIPAEPDAFKAFLVEQVNPLLAHQRYDLWYDLSDAEAARLQAVGDKILKKEGREYSGGKGTHEDLKFDPDEDARSNVSWPPALSSEELASEIQVLLVAILQHVKRSPKSYTSLEVYRDEHRMALSRRGVPLLFPQRITPTNKYVADEDQLGRLPKDDQREWSSTLKILAKEGARKDRFVAEAGDEAPRSEKAREALENELDEMNEQLDKTLVQLNAIVVDARRTEAEVCYMNLRLFLHNVTHSEAFVIHNDNPTADEMERTWLQMELHANLSWPNDSAPLADVRQRYFRYLYDWAATGLDADDTDALVQLFTQAGHAKWASKASSGALVERYTTQRQRYVDLRHAEYIFQYIDLHLSAAEQKQLQTEYNLTDEAAQAIGAGRELVILVERQREYNEIRDALTNLGYRLASSEDEDPLRLSGKTLAQVAAMPPKTTKLSVEQSLLDIDPTDDEREDQQLRLQRVFEVALRSKTHDVPADTALFILVYNLSHNRAHMEATKAHAHMSKQGFGRMEDVQPLYVMSYWNEYAEASKHMRIMLPPPHKKAVRKEKEEDDETDDEFAPMEQKRPGIASMEQKQPTALLPSPQSTSEVVATASLTSAPRRVIQPRIVPTLPPPPNATAEPTFVPFSLSSLQPRS